MKTGINKATIHTIVTGSTSSSFLNVLAICEALGLTVKIEKKDE